MQPTAKVAVIVDDMFFAAKILGAAQAAGKEILRIKSDEQLREITTDLPSLTVIDLNSDRIDPLRAIQFLKSDPRSSAIPVVGFLSHIQVELKRQAEEAGCDYVIPRSVFSQMLPEIISGNLSALPARKSTH
jgi:CheY-like chemotaxis protein